MSKLYIIVENRNQIEPLMQPFDIERIVPTITNISTFIKQEKEHLKEYLFYIDSQFNSTEDFYNQYNTKLQEHYRKYVLIDIPLYLSNTKEGDAALWKHIKYQYGIDDNDQLPNNKFIRRFNPTGKWDYYTIDESPKSSQRVSDITNILLSKDTSLLLPNYLWIEQNDTNYNTATRQRFIDQFINCRYAVVEYHN